MQTVDIEKENKEIIRRYRKLLRHAKPFLKDDDAKIIKKAFFTSLQAHKDMRRRSGEPYIYHPLAVAQIAVEEIGLGTTSIIAALLHDVVAISGLVNPSFFEFVHRTVNVDTYGDTKGQTFADFRPNSKSEGARIALEIDAEKFIQDNIKIML